SRWAAVRGETKSFALAMGTLLLPAIGLLAHLANAHEKSVCATDESIVPWLRSLAHFSFLHTVAPSDLILANCVRALLFLGLAGVVGGAVWRRRYDWRGA